VGLEIHSLNSQRLSVLSHVKSVKKEESLGTIGLNTQNAKKTKRAKYNKGIILFEQENNMVM
jgi:hypothetical protein